MGKMLTDKGLLLLLLVFLSTGAVLFLLSGKGESSMRNSIATGGALSGKPPLDENLTGRLETATFALG